MTKKKVEVDGEPGAKPEVPRAVPWDAAEIETLTVRAARPGRLSALSVSR
jgi:hypothetical protein